MPTMFHEPAAQRCTDCQVTQGRMCACRDALGLEQPSWFDRWVTTLTPRHGLLALAVSALSVLCAISLVVAR